MVPPSNCTVCLCTCYDVTATKDELGYPIAFSVMVHGDPRQLELLLRQDCQLTLEVMLGYR